MERFKTVFYFNCVIEIVNYNSFEVEYNSISRAYETIGIIADEFKPERRILVAASGDSTDAHSVRDLLSIAAARYN